VPLHQLIQRVLLIGVRLQTPTAPPTPRPPAALLPLVAAIEPAHERFDRLAVEYGHRYRSGFWAIYLLSAFAVLFAILPLALGWDSVLHELHPYAGLWAVAEVLVIGTVSLIYWRGHRSDWHGEWLRARTTAELSSYLPMLAPLIDLEEPTAHTNWYLRVFDPDPHVRDADEVAALCSKCERQARDLMKGAWADPAFIRSYATWAVEIIGRQRSYHGSLAARQHALLERTHSINAGLFGLTAVGALLHLGLHTRWLSVATTFFPALGASLHGAMAQSEARRLATSSERLVGELQLAAERIGAAADAAVRPGGDIRQLKASVQAAVALILKEHHDWNLVVRPHHLPLG